jgi:ComF family protein
MATLVPLRLRRLVDTFLDVLLPRTCVACREIVTTLEPLCPRCADALAALPIPAPLAVDVAGGTTLHVQALFPFTGPARELVHALKYQNRRDAAQPLAELAAARFGPELASTILVPIPLHPRRERARGYNQSAVLAAAIAEATGARLLPALVRTRSTRSQTKLGRGARAGNVAGAFGLALPGIPTPGLVILVDDVVTTGATLGAAAAALTATEAVRIGGLAAAHEL